MNLRTRYMGLDLRTPLVASAGPLTRRLDSMKRLEDAGISAVVMPSLFEEQIHMENESLHHYLQHPEDSYAEATTYLPDLSDYNAGPREYLETIRRAKEALSIPVIGSLNGHTPGGWTDYSREIAQAGADALEVNIYYLAADQDIPGAIVEREYLDVIREVRRQVRIPLAVKVGPYFSSMAHMARRMADAGADGLVLFNRFYQPDIDLDSLDVEPSLQLSDPYESRLTMRWIAILHGRVRASLAATSGVHTGRDALKLLLAGADATMLCSALLKHGHEHAGVVEAEMAEWMTEHEYDSVEQLKGSMSQESSANPEAFERASYIRVLDSYKTPA